MTTDKIANHQKQYTMNTEKQVEKLRMLAESARQNTEIPENYINGYIDGINAAIKTIKEIANRKPMSRLDMADTIKREGECGFDDNEKYIDIYDDSATMSINNIKSKLNQLVYFSGEDRLCGFFLNDYEGCFVDYEEFPKELQEKVSTYDFWYGF